MVIMVGAFCRQHLQIIHFNFSLSFLQCMCAGGGLQTIKLDSIRFTDW